MLWKLFFGIFGPLALVGAAYLFVEHYFENKGAAKVEAQVAASHKAAVTAASADSSAMAATSVKIGQETAAATAANDGALAKAIKDQHDDYAKPLGPVVAAPSFDLGGLSPSINLLVDRAVGAAETSDTAGRAAQDGTP